MAPIMRAALVLCFLLALAASAGAQSATNYTVLYQTYPLCDLATDGSGSIYILLCDGDVVKLAPNGTQLTAFQAQYKAALNSSTAFARPLLQDKLRVSATGTVWVMDEENAQLVGVAGADTATPTVYVISTLALDDTTDFSIAPNSENLWLLTPGASWPLQLLTPQGAVVQQWNATNTPALANFFGFAVQATATSLLVGGCFPANAFIYLDYSYDGYQSNGEEFYPNLIQGCKVLQLGSNGSLQQTYIAKVPALQGLYAPFGNISFFEAMAVGAGGFLYAYEFLNGITYQWGSNGSQLFSNFTTFTDFATSPSGIVYAPTSSDPFAVAIVNPANVSISSSFEYTVQSVGREQSVALSPTGSIIYATAYNGNRVLQLNASTGAFIGYLGAGLLSKSEWLATDSAGNIYVSDAGAAVVYKLSSNGTVLLTITGAPNASFGNPQGVAINPVTGELVVVDRLRTKLLIFSSAGVYSRSIDTTQFLDLFDNPAVDLYYYEEYFSQPLAVAVSSTGAIVYTDTGLHDVVIIPASGNATSLVSSAVVSADVFQEPYSITIANDGRVFVASTQPYGVYVFSLTGQLVNTIIYPAQNLGITGLAYNAALNLLYGADEINSQIVSFSAATPPTANGSLCILLYGLPGNVDYPWSVAFSLQFGYLPTPVSTRLGPAYQLVNGVGTRTYTNRFGISSVIPTALRVSYTSQLLYLNSSFPFDQSGLFVGIKSAVQLPGEGPTNLYFAFQIYNASGYVADGGDQRIDNKASAVLSSVPGFRNLTIGASNVNSLAANYATCQAAITFTNGLRTPTQPSASNGAVRFRYTYNISDGKTYWVYANLTMTASSAFATTTDELGNPYQTLTGISGTRLYAHLPTGQQLLSNVTGLFTPPYLTEGDQRFYPYSLLASAPGVYTQTTAPFVDIEGINYGISPNAPVLGDPIFANTSIQADIDLWQATTLTAAYLTEDTYFNTVPVPALQQQTFTLLQ